MLLQLILIGELNIKKKHVITHILLSAIKYILLLTFFLPYETKSIFNNIENVSRKMTSIQWLQRVIFV